MLRLSLQEISHFCEALSRSSEKLRSAYMDLDTDKMRMIAILLEAIAIRIRAFAQGIDDEIRQS